jgi:DNA-binding LacI/PurR family transcriptional regulator
MDSRLTEGIPFIGTDNRQSVSMMVDYLCRSGTPPALFTMPPANVNVLERREAYARRMEELGHQPRILNPDQGLIGDDYERYGFERFLTLSPEAMDGVRTILCPNDRVAFGLMAAISKLGMKIGNGPGDAMRVAGHDGQRFGAYAVPSLTTSAQNTRAIGEAVARALLDPATGLPNRDVLFDGVLLCRNSA